MAHIKWADSVPRLGQWHARSTMSVWGPVFLMALMLNSSYSSYIMMYSFIHNILILRLPPLLVLGGVPVVHLLSWALPLFPPASDYLSLRPPPLPHPVVHLPSWALPLFPPASDYPPPPSGPSPSCHLRQRKVNDAGVCIHPSTPVLNLPVAVNATRQHT